MGNSHFIHKPVKPFWGCPTWFCLVFLVSNQENPRPWKNLVVHMSFLLPLTIVALSSHSCLGLPALAVGASPDCLLVFFSTGTRDTRAGGVTGALLWSHSLWRSLDWLTVFETGEWLTNSQLSFNQFWVQEQKPLGGIALSYVENVASCIKILSFYKCFVYFETRFPRAWADLWLVTLLPPSHEYWAHRCACCIRFQKVFVFLIMCVFL